MLPSSGEVQCEQNGDLCNADTEALLGELQGLQSFVARLRVERRFLNDRLQHTEAGLLRSRAEVLERRIAATKEERERLNGQFHRSGSDSSRFVERYRDIENQNADLASLYVSAMQLHSSLRFSEVITVIKDIVINLIGSEDFAVYLREPADDRLRIIAHMGLERHGLNTIASRDNVSMNACRSSEFHMQNLKPGQRDNPDGSPVACVPLQINEHVYGVISIYSLLPQKEGFAPLDFELFQFLQNHAAKAILVSRLGAYPSADSHLCNAQRTTGRLPH